MKEYGITSALIAGICVIGVFNLWRAGQLASRSDAVDIFIALAAASAFT